MNVFINMTNHPSANWSEKQKKAAEAYGRIMDISFPSICPNWSDQQIDRLAEQYRDMICRQGHPVVLLQGDFVFTYRLTCLLKQAGIRVVAACSVRNAVETKPENGIIQKTSLFEFSQFRDY